MQKEQEKAINNLIYTLEIHHIDSSILFDMKNLIQTQQEEIEKKDKIIDEMACTIYDYANLGKLGICDCELEDGTIDLDMCNQTLADRNCNNCIKQYFERKINDDK